MVRLTLTGVWIPGGSLTLFDGGVGSSAVLGNVSGTSPNVSAPSFVSSDRLMLLVFTPGPVTATNGTNVTVAVTATWAWPGPVYAVTANCGGSAFAEDYSAVTASTAAAYANSVNCAVSLSTRSGLPLTLAFFALSLQPQDAVYVYDGASVTSPLLALLTGSSAALPLALPSQQPVVVTSGGTLCLSFVTTASGTSSGFSATILDSAFNVTRACPGPVYVLVRDGYRNLVAPGNVNTTCAVLVASGSSLPVSLSLRGFVMPPSGGVWRAYDGPSVSYPLVATLSGTVSTGTTVGSTGPVMLLVFTPGNSSGGGGGPDVATYPGFSAYLSTVNSLTLSAAQVLAPNAMVMLPPVQVGSV